jgi:preprotein translocase subunit SecD
MRTSKFFLVLTSSLLLSISSGFADNTTNNTATTTEGETHFLQDEPDSSLRFEIVRSQLRLTPIDIVSAQMTSDENGQFSVEITLDEQAAQTLARNTKNALGRTANIVLDHEILSTSIIRSQLDGTFKITGLSKASAEALVAALTSTQVEQPLTQKKG